MKSFSFEKYSVGVGTFRDKYGAKMYDGEWVQWWMRGESKGHTVILRLSDNFPKYTKHYVKLSMSIYFLIKKYVKIRLICQR